MIDKIDSKEVAKLINRDDLGIYWLMKKGLLVRPYKTGTKGSKSWWDRAKVVKCLPAIKEYQIGLGAMRHRPKKINPKVRTHSIVDLYKIVFSAMKANVS